MQAVPVVVMQPERQMLGAEVGGFIGARIGPFPQGSLDEALGLAVGLRRIGLGLQMAQPQSLAETGEALA